MCNKSFHDEINLIVHNRIQTGERRHQCDTREKAFSGLEDLKLHKVIIIIHTAERRKATASSAWTMYVNIVIELLLRQ